MGTVEKVVEIPEVQTVAGATRSVNVPSAPVRQTAPAEVVQVTEVGPPLPAESAPATRSQAPMAGGVTYGGGLGGVGVGGGLGVSGAGLGGLTYGGGGFGGVSYGGGVTT